METTRTVAAKIEKPCRKIERGDCDRGEHCFNCNRHLDGDLRCPKGCDDVADDATLDAANGDEE